MNAKKPEFDAHQFLKEKVKPHLTELTLLQRKTSLAYLVGIFFVILTLAIWLGLGYSDGKVTLCGFTVIVALVACVIGWSSQTEYRQRFKYVVVKEIIQAIDPNYHYEPEASISEDVYNLSYLFSHPAETYDGDDLVRGTVGKTDFCFSEVHTQYSTTSTDSKGNTTTTWHDIFWGIFFHADFHKEFKGETYVLPDVAEKLFGKWLGQGLQSMSWSRGQLIKLEDSQFENAFVVYGADQQEARYILSPSLMERILKLRAKFGEELRVSFIKGRVYIAIPVDGGKIFEPSVWSGGIDASVVELIYELVTSITAIIEDLNLNTRIWTKE